MEKKSILSRLRSYVKQINVYSIFVENRLTFSFGLCIIKKHSYPIQRADMLHRVIEFFL